MKTEGDLQKTEFSFPGGGKLCTAVVTCGQGTVASLSSHYGDEMPLGQRILCAAFPSCRDEYLSDFW